MSTTNYPEIIAKTLNIGRHQVKNTITLLEEGCTIPFLSRYRKEATGSLDETQISDIKDQLEALIAFDKRKVAILKSLTEQDVLTKELQAKIDACSTLTDLEDAYLPYKPKRKTKASIAKEKGLEPLAKILFNQKENNISSIARNYINKDVSDIEEALQGARDIIAEWVSEDSNVRNEIREVFSGGAVVSTKVVKKKIEEGEKYKDYFEFDEPLNRCPSHRVLAMMRGEREGVLRFDISPNEEYAVRKVNKLELKGYNQSSDQVKIAIEDSYKRLIKPSIEKEFYNEAKDKADDEAISVFEKNLRQLLMSPPLGQKRILAIDPGFRTGCKVVCIDDTGKLLHNETIYPHPPQNDQIKAIKKISQMVQTYAIEAIAIGNGTAGRETESLIKKVKFDRQVQVFVVSEAGASVYSASKIAREEFPQYDVTVRGAVSIGRRLMDPLSELVKIDPKSIGVGQYQHDVNQTKLANRLTQVVESCVNQVGVELNTASKHLLTYVSGLGPALAENIVNYRDENGKFTSRKELMKVAKMGKKTFEQCAGFLRIKDAKNPLDNSAVHPERYKLVEQIAKDKNCKVQDLISNEEATKQIDLNKYVSDSVGLPTLKDIVEELQKPGRDPRESIKIFEFAENIHTIDDLSLGMTLPGIITNITNFGAFVDIGIKENGLVHISNICDAFITNPSEVLELNQHVKVKVLEVDTERKRIQLQMKGVEQ